MPKETCTYNTIGFSIWDTVYETTCDEESDHDIAKWKYCPFCGKKIKRDTDNEDAQT